MTNSIFSKVLSKVPAQHKEEIQKSMAWFAAGLASYFLLIFLLVLAGIAFSYFRG